MSTLIAVYNSEGCVGRCDAKCYEAEPGSECDCICGGMNHGAGAAKAQQNTERHAERMVRRYVNTHEVGEYRAELGEVVQPRLL